MSIYLYFGDHIEELKFRLSKNIFQKKNLQDIFSYDAVFSQSTFASKTWYHYLLEENQTLSMINFFTYGKNYDSIYLSSYSLEEQFVMMYSFLKVILENKETDIISFFNLRSENLLLDTKRILNLIRDYERYLPFLFKNWSDKKYIISKEELIQKEFYHQFYHYMLSLKPTIDPDYGSLTLPKVSSFSEEWGSYKRFHFILPLWNSFIDLSILFWLSENQNKDVYIYLSCQKDSMGEERNQYNEWITNYLKDKTDVIIEQLNDTSIKFTKTSIRIYHEKPALNGFNEFQDELEAQYHSLYKELKQKNIPYHRIGVILANDSFYNSMVKYYFNQHKGVLKTHFLQYEALENQTRLFFTKLSQLIKTESGVDELISFLNHPWVLLKMGIESAYKFDFFDAISKEITPLWSVQNQHISLDHIVQEWFLSPFFDTRYEKKLMRSYSIETFLTFELILFFLHQIDSLKDPYSTIKNFIYFFTDTKEMDPHLMSDINSKLDIIKKISKLNRSISSKDILYMFQLIYEELPLIKENFQSSLIKKVSIGQPVDLLGAHLESLSMIQFNNQEQLFPFFIEKAPYNLRVIYHKDQLKREEELLWIRLLDLIHHTKKVKISYTKGSIDVSIHPLYDFLIKHYEVKVIDLKEREEMPNSPMKDKFHESLEPLSLEDSPSLSKQGKETIEDHQIAFFLKNPFYHSIKLKTSLGPKVKNRIYKSSHDTPLWLLGSYEQQKLFYQFCLETYFQLQETNDYSLENFKKTTLLKVKSFLYRYSSHSLESIYRNNHYNNDQINYFIQSFTEMIDQFFKCNLEKGFQHINRLRYKGYLNIDSTYQIDKDLIYFRSHSKKTYILGGQLEFFSFKKEDRCLFLNVLLSSNFMKNDKHKIFLNLFISSIIAGYQLMTENDLNRCVISLYGANPAGKIEPSFYNEISLSFHEISEYLDKVIDCYNDKNSPIISLQFSNIIDYLKATMSFKGNSSDIVSNKIELLKETYEKIRLDEKGVNIERTCFYEVNEQLVDLLEMLYLFILDPKLLKKESSNVS